MRRAVLLLAVLVFSGCAEDEPQAPAVNNRAPELLSAGVHDEDAEFEKLVLRHTRAMLRADPELATVLGATPADAGPAFQRGLTDRSPIAREELRALNDRLYSELSAIDRDQLTGRARRLFTALEDGYRLAAQRNDFEFGEGAAIGTGAPYAMSHAYGPHLEVPRLLLEAHPLTTLAEARDYTSRLSAFAESLSDVQATLLADAQEGVSPPPFSLDRAAETVAAMHAVPPGQHALLARFNEAVGKLPDLSPEERTAMRAEAGKIVADEVYPALVEMEDTLHQLARGSPEGDGIARLPRGRTFYQHRLRAHGGEGREPSALLAAARSDLVAKEAEIDEALAASGIAAGTVGERLAAMGSGKGMVFPDTDEARELLVITLADGQKTAARQLPAFFESPPDDLPVLRRTARAEEAVAPLTRYQRSRTAGSGRPVIALNLQDTAAFPRYTLPALTAKAAIPGEHLRTIYPSAEDPLAPVRPLLFAPMARAAWDSYAGTLAAEMGRFDGDVGYEIGRLQGELASIAAAVADLYVHSEGWSCAEAAAFLQETAGLSESVATGLAERIAVDPAASLAPWTGMGTIEALRARAEEELGEAFDVRAFHDMLLTPGLVPVPLLEARMEEWLSENRS